MDVSGQSTATPSAPVVSQQAPAAQAGEVKPETSQEQKEEAQSQEDPKFASRFAALTRREKTVVEREKKLKADESAFQVWKKAKEDATLNPLAYLEAGGLSYTQVTDFLIEQQGGKKELTADEKIELLQRQIEEDKQARQAEKDAAEKADVEATIEGHKKAIRDVVDTDADTFELIRTNDAYDVVHAVIQEHWEKTGAENGGEILSIADAANAVEKYLENQVQEKVFKTKKFAPKREVAEVKIEGEPKTSVAPTLTNRQATAAAPVSSKEEYLSDEESKRRAASMLRWV